ncbi:CMRF35-like molecule 7 isoform X3 [Meles meles]|uniref:CMRF35-like molecule 7 isoform X3 n=1 Tax=Meles meles TaxID=9662 RepID=UPI001E69BC72|nr:CMRF35-like molecule 7 isoform X3 [Meles meles]
MWPLPVLFLLIIQGYFSKCQDGVVRGRATGTLTTHCVYGPGWESYKKWWCRGENWISCKILVKTTGSEQLVKKGRASIQDNKSQRKFTMTLEDLRTGCNRLSQACAKHHTSQLGLLTSVYPGHQQQPARDSDQPHQQVGEDGLLCSRQEASCVDPPAASFPCDPGGALPKMMDHGSLQDSGQ